MTDEPLSHIDHPKSLHPRTFDLPQFFGIVETQIYRFPPSSLVSNGRCSSETLQPIHYPYIQTLELTTILVLSPEKPSRSLKSFAEENSIRLVCILGGYVDGRFILVYKDGNRNMRGLQWRKD